MFIRHSFMSSRAFHLFVVHTPKLVARHQRLQNTISFIRGIVTDEKYEFRLHMVTKPDPEHLREDLHTLDKRISYEPVGIEAYDKARVMLSLEEISNYEKHRDVWKRITNEANTDVFMVIEDDTFQLPDAQHTFKELLSSTHKDTNAYDFLTFALSKSANESATGSPIELHDTRDVTNAIPSKDAYFISKRAATLLHTQSDTIRFTMRFQISYMMFKNPSLKWMYPSQRIFLEGSKVGMYPSSIHGNNILIYNREYMEMLSYMNNPENIDLRKIRSLYREISHLRSPDVMHIYGVLLFKANEVKEAQEVLIEAVELAKKQNGVVNFSSDILNNTINIHEFTQWDLGEIMQNPSKYMCSS